MARQEKQYAVEVIERWAHGRYGKDFYFGLYVPGFNKKDAEEVAIETLAGMSFNEIKSRCVDQHRQYPWEIWWQGEHERKNGENAPIGFELAESFFTCRAYIEK